MGDVIDLTVHLRLDVAGLTRRRLADLRRSLGHSPDEFAAALGKLLDWTPSAEAVVSWETEADPPGSVMTAAELMGRQVDRGTASGAAEPRSRDAFEDLLAERFADVAAVYLSRSAFTSALPPHALFDGAGEVWMAGLSLNLLCQQYSDQRLIELVEGGCRMRCLFLDPAGMSIAAREREEGYVPGRLSTLTDMNLHILMGLRGQLSEAASSRLEIATYDEPIRFNILLIDDQLCIAQPYLPAMRGVDSPTLVIRRAHSGAGLFSVFRSTFEWLWNRRQPQ